MYETAILLAFSTHLLLFGLISLIGRKVHHPLGAVVYATFNTALWPQGIQAGLTGSPSPALPRVLTVCPHGQDGFACIEIGAAVILVAVEIPLSSDGSASGAVQGKA